MRYNCLCVILVCIALTACLLSASSPHGEKRDETASDQTTQQTVSAYDDVSTDAATGTEIDPQKKQSTPSVESSGQEEITTATEPDTDTEPGGGGIVIDPNGDILLPEVP